MKIDTTYTELSPSRNPNSKKESVGVNLSTELHTPNIGWQPEAHRLVEQISMFTSKRWLDRLKS
jgi:hypothetical protein